MRPNATGYCVLDNSLHNTTNSIRNLTQYPNAQILQQHQPTQQFGNCHPTPSWAQHGCFNNSPHQQQTKNIAPCHGQPPKYVPLQATAPQPINYLPSHSQFPSRPHNLHANHQRNPHTQETIFHQGNNNYMFQCQQPALHELTHNYAKLPPNVINQQRISECAGIPLISSSSSHLTPSQRQRIYKKTTRPASQPTHAKSVNDSNLICKSNSFNRHAGNTSYINNGNCMSQLAVHAQGLPLLLNKHQQQHSTANANCINWNSSVSGVNLNKNIAQQQFSQLYKPEKSRLLRYQNSAPAILNTRSKDSVAYIQNDAVKTTLSSPCTESKDLNETCLPRIIKPRKRRKKDRKPPNGVFLKLETDLERNISQVPMEAQHIKLHKSTENLLSALTFYNNNLTYMSLKKNVCPSSDSTHHLYNSEATAKSLCLSKSTNSQHASYGVCFCAECDPIRSLWDYPLRRSLSDSSAASNSEKSSTTTSDTSSSCSSANTSDTDSFSPITTKHSRADIVGVIGSNRLSHDINHSNPHKPTITTFQSATQNCFSDSNDSGYGDILSGINIADDFFNHNSNSSATNADTRNVLLTHETMPIGTTALLLLPETAETLLNESINEISRKLIETCGNELPELPTSSSISSFSACSDFSDSGIDSAGSRGSGVANINCDELVFNFDHLNISASDSLATSPTSTSLPYGNEIVNGNRSENAAAIMRKVQATATTTTTTTPSNFLISPTNDLCLDLNNNHKGAMQQNNNFNVEQKQKDSVELRNQQFLINCFDLMWQNAHGNNNKHTSSYNTNNYSNSINSNDETAMIFNTLGKLKETFSTIS